MAVEVKNKKVSITKLLTQKLDNESNDSFAKKESLGYINRDKPIKSFYIRMFIFSFMVVFFVVNMTIAFIRYAAIPDSSYYLTTMDGRIHKIEPSDVTKEKLLLLKKEYEKNAESKD